MTSIQEVTLSMWDKYAEFLGKFVFEGIPEGFSYCFRGHEDSSWKLEPSLHRILKPDLKSPLPDGAEMLRIERYLGHQFRSMAPTQLPPGTMPQGWRDFDWWPIMRHYGVPTRLLDWTTSGYVATYFAVCRQPNRDGVVYIVHGGTVAQAMMNAYGSIAELPQNDEDFQNADSPPIINLFFLRWALPERIIAQQGVFMVCRRIDGDIEETLTSTIPKEKLGSSAIVLRRIRIPGSSKASFMRQLRAMNVTASSLFPGLDGIGRHLEETVRWR